jgi:hypothetical protein
MRCRSRDYFDAGSAFSFGIARGQWHSLKKSIRPFGCFAKGLQLESDLPKGFLTMPAEKGHTAIYL